MSFEHMPPAAFPDTTPPKKPEIEFTPERIFGPELEVAREIAIAKSGSAGDFTEDTFHAYMDTLGRLEEGYVRAAATQNEGDETALLVRTAFESLKVSEWNSHSVFGRRTNAGEIPGDLKSEVLWESYAAQYLGKLNQKYDQKIATARAAGFWAEQQRMWKSKPDGAPFEQLKNGILRSVALEHILSQVNGWEMYAEQDATVDAIDKIDLIAISDSDRMFLFQIKERDIANKDALLQGWAIQEVMPYGQKEYDYLGKFQKGIERYIRESGIDGQEVTGIYAEISAGTAFMNKETGMPKEEFARSLGATLQALDRPIYKEKAA